MLSRPFAAALLVTCLALAPLAAQADEASHRKAAEVLLQESGMTGTLKKTTADMVAASTQNMSPNSQKIVRDFFEKYYGWEEMIGNMAKFYVENFSEEELNEVIAFYRTPTGKKTVDLMPELMKKSVMLSQKNLEAHMPELMAALAADQKKAGEPKEPAKTP